MKKTAKSDPNEIRPEDAEIGAKLAAARKAAGMTQGEAAEAAGWGSKDELVGQKRISAYETGRRSIGLSEFLAYAKAIGADPASILGMKKVSVRQRT